MSKSVNGSNSDDSMFWSIALAVLKEGNQVRFGAPGKSMAPFIRHGETVTVIPCSPRDLKWGDIILYSTSLDPAASPKRIHRVIKVKVEGRNPLVFTKGDALSSLDGPIDPQQVLGKVSAIKKGRRALDLNQPWGKAISLICGLLQRWAFSRWGIHMGYRVGKAVFGPSSLTGRWRPSREPGLFG